MHTYHKQIAKRTVIIFPLMILFSLSFPLSVFAQETRSAMWNYTAGRELENSGRLSEGMYFYNEAVRIATGEISRNAANSDSYAALTWTLQRQERYADVISWGERALGIYPDDYRIIEVMGEAYFYLGNHNASLRYMQRYVHALPQGGRASIAYFFIGEIYRLSRRFRHAEVAYSTAVLLEPYVALWWYRLGTVREAEGDYPEAITAYERALNLNSAYRLATEGLTRSRSRLSGS